MSSILSTSACGVGTHTTSFPSWPTEGSYSFAGCAWASAEVRSKARPNVDNVRCTKRESFILNICLLQLCIGDFRIPYPRTTQMSRKRLRQMWNVDRKHRPRAIREIDASEEGG